MSNSYLKQKTILYEFRYHSLISKSHFGKGDSNSEKIIQKIIWLKQMKTNLLQ